MENEVKGNFNMKQISKCTIPQSKKGRGRMLNTRIRLALGALLAVTMCKGTAWSATIAVPGDYATTDLPMRAQHILLRKLLRIKMIGALTQVFS